MHEISARIQELSDKQGLMRLSYLAVNGYPKVVPVWFARVDHFYYVGTEATSAKSKAIQRDPRAGWVIDGGENHRFWGASYSGRLEEVSDAAIKARAYSALGEKYFSSSDDPEFVKIYGKVDDPATVYFRLVPETVYSWDY
jgi:nitroimidazol reductase NimA-like FMN-containing flavoprotein (pyridoxamine 5'-phosphate oxidase superfamily)